MARIALMLEALWSASFWPLIIVAVATLVILSGAAGLVPVSVRLAVGGLFALAFLVSLKAYYRLSLPTTPEALRRIEQRSGLAHRPVTAWREDMAGPEPSGASATLWQAHKQRMAKVFNRLKSGTPRSDFARRDRNAWRNGLALALVATALLNGSNWKFRLLQLVSNPVQTHTQLTIDGWISPPAFTGRAPVLLTGPLAEKQRQAGIEIVVPEASMLIIRINGAKGPEIVLSEPGNNGQPGREIAVRKLQGASTAGVFEDKSPLNRPVHVAVRDGKNILARWTIAVLPDRAPNVAVKGKISITATGAFAAPWHADDDYGVKSIRATVKLARKGKKIAGNAPAALKYDAPEFPVSLPRLNPKKATGRLFRDLTEHPWAGSLVQLTLMAKDQAGHETLSKPVRFRLPERRFHKVLARAIIELRRDLVQAPMAKDKVVKALVALMAWPDGLFEKSGHYLGLRSAARQLYKARSDDETRKVVALLWEIALSIEQGDMTGALRELEAIRRQLQKALAEGASPEKIAELMAKMRAALDRYTRAMARQMQQNLKNGQQPQQPRGNAREIDAKELKDMMDAIENLARSGARDAAQEMLSQLENILRNMQPGVARKMAPQRSAPMARMLNELGKLMRRQQQLMDETYRMPQGQVRPGGKQHNNRSGSRTENKPGGPNSLARQQEALSRLLDQMMKQMSRRGMQSPDALKGARKEMQGAARNLRRGNQRNALGNQGNALQGMRRGAQSLARNLLRQGTGNEGNYGRHGQGKGDSRDPLGRPMPGNSAEFGSRRNILPGKAAIQRARKILDVLRRRAGDRQRPRAERDYIGRLLKGLY